MRSHSVAASLVGIYLAAVVIVLELVAWWRDSSATIDPAALSAPLLKRLLHVRGIDYTAVVDKSELSQLALEVGPVTVGEVEELKDTLPEGPAEFSGGPHLYEQVEDTKDSAWLLQVGRRPLLDDLTWQLVRRQLAPFAIRTGIFQCELDPRLCMRKGWTEPMLLLVLPRGSRPKDTVFTTTSKLTKLQAIIGWVRRQISLRVERVAPETQQEWFEDKNSTSLLPVRVLLYTHLLYPPLFFAALTIKFAGRISFGMVTVGKGEDDSGGHCKGTVPCYFVVTPEEVAVYGKRHGQHYNLAAMQAFLRPLQPEANDVFLAMLAIVNIYAILLSFQMGMDYGWIGAIASGIGAVSVCNLMLFFGWLIAPWQWLPKWMPNGAPLLRWLALSSPGAAVVANLPRLAESPVASLVSLFVFAYVARRLLGRRTPPATRTLSEAWVELFREGPRSAELGGIAPHLWLAVGTSGPPPGYTTALPIIRRGDLQILLSDDCAICLDRYTEECVVCGLPCGHWFHHKCISAWLDTDNHICPLCRWPAYQPMPVDTRKHN